MIKNLLSFLFSFAFCLCFTSFAQPISKPVNNLTLFFEKVYLHTDRELYLPGEDIWLKAYLINAQTNHPFSSSNNLYVELISPGSEIITRNVIRMDNSMGKGDFKLADTLSAGTYKLRAYTNWMRNFGENFVFEKSIRIAKEVEPIKPVIAKKKSAAKAGTEKILIVNQPLKSNQPTIRFFPEGGSLVEGIPSRVAFKIEGPDGKGVSAKGVILSSKGDTLSTFNSNVFGMGSFSIKPQAGEKYTASGSLEGKQPFLAQLPKALLSGFTLYVQEKDSLINVMTFLNEATSNANFNKSLLLVVKQGGKTSISTEIAVTSRQLITRISKLDLPSGINAITLYDSEKRPQCERLIFIPEKEKITLSIAPDKTRYKPKEKVTLNIKASDSKGNPVKTNLSLSVTDAGIIPENEGDIKTYLLLQSEIRGKIENPKQYFDESNPERQKQLELLLLTQGWRDFLWKRVADTTIRITKVLEQGITISGRAKESGGNKPLVKANISLRTPNAKGTKFFSTQTDSLGRFFIDRLELYGTQGIKLAALNNKGEPFGRLTMDSVFNDTMKVRKPLSKPVISQADSLDENVVLAKGLLQRKRTYRLSDTIQLDEVKIKQKKKPIQLFQGVLMDFGYPDENFIITSKDYDFRDVRHYLLTNSSYATTISGGCCPAHPTHFTTSEREIKRCRYCKKKYDDEPPESNFATTPSLNWVVFRSGVWLELPKFIINGKEVLVSEDESDAGFADITIGPIFELPMSQIEKITIKKMMGTSFLAPTILVPMYVLDITTKPGVFDWKQRDKVIALINGYYQSRTFYSPVYDKPDTKTDARNTVFWEPFLETNDKGEATVSYYNADPQGKMRIAAEGLGGKGGIAVMQTGYEVK